MAFFANDLEDYKQERDFYYDYRSFIPGPFFTETDRLAYWIKEAKFDQEMIRAFRNRFFDNLDGKSSQRVIEYLITKTPKANRWTQHNGKSAR
jgi:CDP-ribitol ribitolphosphotransferase